MVGLLQFMKRKRLMLAGSNSAQQPDHLLPKQTDSVSTSMDESTEHEDAPWKAVAVLSRIPIKEKDWWTTGTTTSASHPSRGGGTGMDHTTYSPRSKDISMDSSSTSGTASTLSSVESSSSSSMQFHNRGYEVWEQCRMAWLQQGKETEKKAAAPSPSSSPNSSRRSRPPLSKYQRRQVMANLARQRQYELPKKLGLNHVIDVYQDIWNQESSD